MIEMKREDTVFSEISQAQGDKYCVISSIGIIHIFLKAFSKTQSRMERGCEKRRNLIKTQNFRMEKFVLENKCTEYLRIICFSFQNYSENTLLMFSPQTWLVSRWRYQLT